MKTKYKVMISGAVVLVLTAASIFSIAAEKLPQYRKITVTSAFKTTMGQTLQLQGYIEPNGKQEIILNTNQKVDQVFVKEGQEVNAGDLLIKLDDSDNTYRQKSEQLNLKAAQEELDSLLKSEGKDKRDLTYSVAQAEIQYNNSLSDYSDAKVKYEYNQKLYSEGFISKEELENSQRSLSKLEGTVKLQEMQLDKAKEALSSYDDTRKQQINKLRNNIELIKMSLDNLNSKIDVSTKALISGRVVKCRLENGQYPNADNSTIEIQDLSKYVVNTYVKQNEAVQMVEGQKAVIVVTGLEQKSYVGTVVDIEEGATMPQGGAKLPMVKIRIEIDQPDNNIRVGFQTEVKLDLNIRTDVIAVNFQGIVEDNKGNRFIYLFKDNKAERKLVRTGIEDGYLVEIIEGIIPGDQYILNPPERVQDQASFKLWSWGYELK